MSGIAKIENDNNGFDKESSSSNRSEISGFKNHSRGQSVYNF